MENQRFINVRPPTGSNMDLSRVWKTQRAGIEEGTHSWINDFQALILDLLSGMGFNGWKS